MPFAGTLALIDAMLTIAPPPPVAVHRLRLVLHRQEHAGEADVDDRPPLLERVLDHRRERPEPRAVHREVEPAELLDRRARPAARRRPRR